MRTVLQCFFEKQKVRRFALAALLVCLLFRAMFISNYESRNAFCFRRAPRSVRSINQGTEQIVSWPEVRRKAANEERKISTAGTHRTERSKNVGNEDRKRSKEQTTGPKRTCLWAAFCMCCCAQNRHLTGSTPEGSERREKEIDGRDPPDRTFET